MELLTANVYLVAGNESSIPLVLNRITGAGISLTSNPDVYVRSYNTFGIDDALELRERSQLRPMHPGMRTFIVQAATMTTEAQNALLKTLEEPPAGALFFFVVPAPEILLPTVRSRAQSLSIGTPPTESLVKINHFLAASIEERLAMIEPLLEKDAEDKRNMGAIIVFLEALERAMSVRDADARTTEALRTIYKVRSYINDKGALVKPLLESVALMV